MKEYKIEVFVNDKLVSTDIFFQQKKAETQVLGLAYQNDKYVLRGMLAMHFDEPIIVDSDLENSLKDLVPELKLMSR